MQEGADDGECDDEIVPTLEAEQPSGDILPLTIDDAEENHGTDTEEEGPGCSRGEPHFGAMGLSGVATVASSIVNELDCAIDRVKLAVRKRDCGGPKHDEPVKTKQEVVVEPLRSTGRRRSRAHGGEQGALYAIWDQQGKELRLRRCDDNRMLRDDGVTLLNLAELQKQYDATMVQMQSFHATLQNLQLSHRET